MHASPVRRLSFYLRFSLPLVLPTNKSTPLPWTEECLRRPPVRAAKAAKEAWAALAVLAAIKAGQGAPVAPRRAAAEEWRAAAESEGKPAAAARVREDKQAALAVWPAVALRAAVVPVRAAAVPGPAEAAEAAEWPMSTQVRPMRVCARLRRWPCLSYRAFTWPLVHP